MLSHQTHPLRNTRSEFCIRLCASCFSPALAFAFLSLPTLLWNLCRYNSYAINMVCYARATRTHRPHGAARGPGPKKRIESGVRVLIGSIYENPLVGMNRPLPKEPFWAPREDPKTTGSFHFD